MTESLKSGLNADTDVHDAASLLYHEPPMVLIDRLVEYSQDTIVCEVDINPDTLFAVEQGVPSYVGLEYMAQTTAAFDGLNRKQRGLEPKIGFLLGTRKLELISDWFTLGATLRITAKLTWDSEDITQYQCEIYDLKSNEKVSSANLTVYSPGVKL